LNCCCCFHVCKTKVHYLYLQRCNVCSFLILLGDIAESDFAYWYRCYHSVVCLFVCLSVTFVHCAQMAEDINTISFAYDSPMSLPDHFKIRLTSVNHFLLKCCPIDRQTVDLSVSDIQWQTAAEWLEIVQWSQWRAYRKPPSLFRMAPSLIPYNLPSQKWSAKCTPRTNFTTRATTWRI